MLDRLFEPGNLRAYLVIPALHLVELVVALGELDSQFLDGCLGRALLGDCGVEACLLLAATRLLGADLVLQAQQSQGQQLGTHPPLLGHQILIA